MLARLVVLSGAKTKQMDLQLPTIIGRGRDSKIKLPASTVSRQHCEIYVYEGQIAIRDLGSSNGTLVNGVRIKGPTFVGAEDEVSVGPIVARFLPVEQKDVQTVPPTEPTVAEETEVPNFDVLPLETLIPVQAVTTVEEEVVPKVEVAAFSGEEPQADAAVFDSEKNEDTDGSVLHYAEPKDAGCRSFVGITPAGDRPDKENSAPPIGDAGDVPDTVDADDGALQDFFKNLDG